MGKETPPPSPLGFLGSMKAATPYVLGFSGLAAGQYATQLGQYGLPINPVGVGEVFGATALEGYAMAGAFMLGANLAQSGVAAVRGVPSVSDLQNIQITGTKTAFTTNLGAPADITGRSFSSVAADINAGKITTANRATVPLNLQIPVNPLENLAGLGFTPITTEAYGMETAAGIRTNIMANDQYSISRNMVTGENNFLVNTNPNANYQNVYGNLQNDISNILGRREPGTEANLGKPGQVSFQNANPIPLSVQNAFGITKNQELEEPRS